MSYPKKNTDPSPEEKPFRSGEKGFAVFWLLFGGYFFYQSMKLYQKYPGLDSCAAVPLFVTGVIVVCALIILLIDRKKPSESSGKAMTWFMRKNYLAAGRIDQKVLVRTAGKNLIWTALAIIFILIVFTYLFKVVLP